MVNNQCFSWVLDQVMNQTRDAATSFEKHIVYVSTEWLHRRISFQVIIFSQFLFCFSFQNTYRSPVYTTSQRRNAMGVGLVFEADLATHEHISHWVLQGVCLTLNSDQNALLLLVNQLCAVLLFCYFIRRHFF